MTARRLSWAAWVLPVAVLLMVAGCSAAGVAPRSSAPVAAVEVPAVEVPVTGATVAPGPGDASSQVPDDLRLVVIVPTSPDLSTSVLADAVVRWADGEGVEVVEYPVVDAVAFQEVTRSVSGGGTLVVVPGAGLVDELDGVSAQSLDVEFLVLGAQLPEPTANVTAVVWPGATSRGSRAPADDAPDDTALTPERAAAAAAAGLASVLAGRTGVVVHLDG